MSAELAVRGALVAALRGDAALIGQVNAVYDGAPVQASAPYVVIEECAGVEWGGKGLDGCEVRLSIGLRDQGESSARLAAMVARLDAAARGSAGTLAQGWRIVTVRLVRSRIMRRVAGPREPGGWQGVVDYRIRAVREEI